MTSVAWPQAPGIDRSTVLSLARRVLPGGAGLVAAGVGSAGGPGLHRRTARLQQRPIQHPPTAPRPGPIGIVGSITIRTCKKLSLPCPPSRSFRCPPARKGDTTMAGQPDTLRRPTGPTVISAGFESTCWAGSKPGTTSDRASARRRAGVHAQNNRPRRLLMEALHAEHGLRVWPVVRQVR
jgi:hypothetical protein